MSIKKVTQFSFKRETVREWKIKYQKKFESQEGVEFFTVPRQRRPSMVSHELVTEIKAILHNLRDGGGAVSLKTVIAIGNGVMSSRCSEKLTKKGGNVTFTIKWARGIPKLLSWMKRGGKTARREMILALYEEENNYQCYFRTHHEMVLKFDQRDLDLLRPSNLCWKRCSISANYQCPM